MLILGNNRSNLMICQVYSKSFCWAARLIPCNSSHIYGVDLS